LAANGKESIVWWWAMKSWRQGVQDEEDASGGLGGRLEGRHVVSIADTRDVRRALDSSSSELSGTARGACFRNCSVCIPYTSMKEPSLSCMASGIGTWANKMHSVKTASRPSISALSGGLFDGSDLSYLLPNCTISLEAAFAAPLA